MLLSWLKDQPLYPKIYWATQNEAIAAAGIANTEEPLQFSWQNFYRLPNFFSPLLIKRGTHQPKPLPPYLVEKRSSLPDREQWTANLSTVLTKISQGELEKVVLARRSRVDCTSQIDPFSLCSALTGQTIFLLQQDPSSAFLGASPETLYRRSGREIECDVLAGTRPLEMDSELLHSEKDVREFLYVQNFLLDVLTPLCVSPPSATPFAVRKYATTCHLHAKVKGILKETINDEEILATLHPTPAVGGIPRKEALSFLSSFEPFDRALYASPIGWKTKEKAEFAVAIRSALIKDCSAQLYAGVGIVTGSDPSFEWEETEWKLSLWNKWFCCL